MVLHDPENLKLPALKIEKKQDRKIIEEDTAVKNLIDVNFLLNKDLNQLLVKFLGTTKEINRLLERRIENLYSESHTHRLSHRHAISQRYRYFQWKLIRKLKKATPKQRKEIEEEIKKELEKEIKKVKKNLKNVINKLSKKLKSELDTL